MPIEIFEEVKDGPKDEERNLLFSWIQQEKVKALIILNEDGNTAFVQQVVYTGYANDLTDGEIE